MKKEFTITMPITGIAVMTVEAETEEQALEEFYKEVTTKDIQEWDCCEKIVQGNVFYGVQNEMEIEEGEEVED